MLDHSDNLRIKYSINYYSHHYLHCFQHPHYDQDCFQWALSDLDHLDTSSSNLKHDLLPEKIKIKDKENFYLRNGVYLIIKSNN